MNITISQKQNRSLLEEHASSSYNFSSLAKYELYIAIGFLVAGILVSIVLYPKWMTGLPMMAIGIWEIVRFPTREKRWVNRKMKEPLFDKDLTFQFQTDSLGVSFDEESRTHRYADMRACMISNTGILFKISLPEYYYISFSSLESTAQKQEILSYLRKVFDAKKLQEKS